MEYYKGEAYSIDQILDMLRERGLEIEDEARARQVLENVSYTRLKNYLMALFENEAAHRYRIGATFENAYALYGFDRRLRELIFHEMEKIEISIRTRIAFASNGSEKGYWFMNPAHFKKPSDHERILRHLKNEIDRSDNEGIERFKRKWANEFPPSWLTLEAASMGTLVTIYENLSDDKLKMNIAGHYGMTPRLFMSWTRHLLAMRNDCAHHNRVWNKVPSVKALVPGSEFDLVASRPFPLMKEQDRSHVYMTFCILRYFINIIKPENSFASRLKILIHNFPMIDPAMMGFPAEWESDPFWD